jgi:hypothetical protein
MSSVNMGRIGVIDLGGRGRHGNHVGPWVWLSIILSGATGLGACTSLKVGWVLTDRRGPCRGLTAPTIQPTVADRPEPDTQRGRTNGSFT